MSNASDQELIRIQNKADRLSDYIKTEKRKTWQPFHERIKELVIRKDNEIIVVFESTTGMGKEVPFDDFLRYNGIREIDLL